MSIGFLGRSDCVFLADFIGEIVFWKLGRGSISYKAHSSKLSMANFLELDGRKIFVTITTLGELSIWNITAAIDALHNTEKNSILHIDNPADMLVFSTNLNCRCSSMIVSSE